jgi:DNA repair protein RadC
MPLEDRPRERLIASGAQVLSNAELVAVLIRTGSRHETAIEVASRLIGRGAAAAAGGASGDGAGAEDANGVGVVGTPGAAAAGLRNLATASIEELGAVRGIGPVKATQIKAAIELGRRLACATASRPAVRTPADVAGLVMEGMRYLDKEHFQVVLLNTKNQVLGVELVSVGGLSSSLVHPREIFKVALRRSAAAIILVHNHPSGDPEPSPEDIGVTGRLVEAGRLLGIEVLDHVVIGDGCYASLRQRGLA